MQQTVHHQVADIIIFSLNVLVYILVISTFPPYNNKLMNQIQIGPYTAIHKSKGRFTNFYGRRTGHSAL